MTAVNPARRLSLMVRGRRREPRYPNYTSDLCLHDGYVCLRCEVAVTACLVAEERSHPSTSGWFLVRDRKDTGTAMTCQNHTHKLDRAGTGRSRRRWSAAGLAGAIVLALTTAGMAAASTADAVGRTVTTAQLGVD